MGIIRGPGSAILSAGGEQLIVPIDADAARERGQASPALQEDILSLSESVPYIILSEPVSADLPCQYCGTEIRAMMEREIADPQRRYRRGIWEKKLGRRHTERRCQAMRSGDV